MSHVPHVGQQFNSTRANGAQVRQSTNEVLMVAPTAFGFNDQVGCKAAVSLLLVYLWKQCPGRDIKSLLHCQSNHCPSDSHCYYHNCMAASGLTGHANDYTSIDRKKLRCLRL